MKRASSFLLLFLSLLGLVLIRYFETRLFYDPLLAFFKTEHLEQRLPNFEFWKLMGFITLRFWINSILSLIIIKVIFKDKNIVRFSALLYFIFFLVLSVLFVFLLYSSPDNYLPLFYVRRFLIQPILVLLLVPAFYFYNKLEK